jgi:hypothetical protein
VGNRERVVVTRRVGLPVRKVSRVRNCLLPKHGQRHFLPIRLPNKPSFRAGPQKFLSQLATTVSQPRGLTPRSIHNSIIRVLCWCHYCDKFYLDLMLFREGTFCWSEPEHRAPRLGWVLFNHIQPTLHGTTPYPWISVNNKDDVINNIQPPTTFIVERYRVRCQWLKSGTNIDLRPARDAKM